MRLWSLHPRFLDDQGLLSCWREGLGAQTVLLKQKGYKHHTQMIRFYNQPFELLGNYLYRVWLEAKDRGKKFDFFKIKLPHTVDKNIISVTTGQLEYEKNFLLEKLEIRKRYKKTLPFYRKRLKEEKIIPNPVFYVIDGPIEKWEKIK